MSSLDENTLFLFGLAALFLGWIARGLYERAVLKHRHIENEWSKDYEKH